MYVFKLKFKHKTNNQFYVILIALAVEVIPLSAKIRKLCDKIKNKRKPVNTFLSQTFMKQMASRLV